MAKMKLRNIWVIFNKLSEIQKEVVDNFISVELAQHLSFDTNFSYSEDEIEENLAEDYIYIKLKEDKIYISVSRATDTLNIYLYMLAAKEDEISLEEKMDAIEAHGEYAIKAKQLIINKFLLKTGISLEEDDIIDCIREAYEGIFNNEAVDVVYEENDSGNYLCF